MKKIDTQLLTAQTIISDETFDEIFDLESAYDREKLYIALLERATELGKKTEFDKLYKAKKRDFKEFDSKVTDRADRSNVTAYDDSDYSQLDCGTWECDMSGVKTYTMFGQVVACYNPVLPVKRLVNLQTGEEKTIIAFYKDYHWKEIIVDNSVLLNANKIIGIVKSGILFSSENAKYLARFFTEILRMNSNIPIQMSTSKMGWLDKYSGFMPFIENEVVFDSESCFNQVFNAIREQGDRSTYIKLLQDIRKRPRAEPNILVAVSLASVLVKPIGLLPFIFHLYGEAGKGKTVATMLAASVWGNPAEDGYLADPKATATVFEVYLDFLDSLPFICDDMSKLKREAHKPADYSYFIYLLAGGTGKKRSNINLGVNRQTAWKNCSITNAEKPITSETSNGGELLRVIEMETAPGVIFDDGSSGKFTADTIRANYGFIGKEFVKIVMEIGFDEVKKIHSEFVERIKKRDITGEKEGKQIQPMALILTADKILTDYIIKDGIYLDFDTCYNLIRSNKQMSDNDRAYEFIINEIGINKANFMPVEQRINDVEPRQLWGYFNADFYMINPNIFSQIAEKGNFSKKMFIEWAVRNGISEVNKGRLDKSVKYKGRFIFIRIPEEPLDDDEEIEPF